MLNKAECQALAQIAARATYSSSATAFSASIADEIVRTFPRIGDDFQMLADIISSEQLALGMIEVICYYVGAESSDPYRKIRNDLYAVKADIAEAVYDWCKSEGTSASALIDANVDFRKLIAANGLREYLTKYSVLHAELGEFSSQLPDGEWDLNSLLN